MEPSDAERLTVLVNEGLAPAIEQAGAVALDGGTDSGIMGLLGRARASAGGFPLVGVAAEGTVALPGGNAGADAARVEPHHTHLLLVPGGSWGDETPWIARTAAALSGGAPAVTVLINGGDVTYADAARSIEDGRPVIVVEGSGRAADEVVSALHGQRADVRAQELASSVLVSSVPADQPASVRSAVVGALEARTD
jgi:hypothetical protein